MRMVLMMDVVHGANKEEDKETGVHKKWEGVDSCEGYGGWFYFIFPFLSFFFWAAVGHNLIWPTVSLRAKM